MRSFLLFAAVLAGVAGSGWLFAQAESTDSVRIVDETGEPVQGAKVTVRATRAPANALESRLRTILETISGSDGRLAEALPGVAGYFVVVDHRDYLPIVRPLPVRGDLALSAGRTVAISTELAGPRMGAVPSQDSLAAFRLQRGVCASWAHDSEVAAGVRFQRCSGWGPNAASLVESRLTAEVSGLPRTEVPLRLAVEEHLPLSATARLPPMDSRVASGVKRNEISLVFEQGTLLSGKVTSVDGEPLARIIVRSLAGAFAFTSPEGEFRLAVRSLPAQVEVLALGYRPVSLRFEQPRRAEPIVLERSTQVTAELPASVLSDQVEVRLERWIDGSRPAWRRARHSLRALEGRIDLYLFEPGLHRLALRVGGFVGYRSAPFQVLRGETTNLGPIAFELGAQLAMRFIDGNTGEPVSGVLARVVAGESTLFSILETTPIARSATSSDEGYVQIAGLVEGEYSVVCSREGYADTVRELVVRNRVPYDLGEVEIDQGAAVRFAVEDSVGDPIERTTISVSSAEGNTGAIASVTGRGKDWSEPIRLGNGTYSVQVEGSRLLLQKPLEVAAGERELDVVLTINSVVVEGSVVLDGLPVDDGFVRIVGRSDPGRRSGKLILAAEPGEAVAPFITGNPRSAVEAVVGDGGAFLLEQVQPGRSLLSYTTQNGTVFERHVVIEDGTRNHLVLEFQRGALSGRTLDESTGEGVSADLRLTDESGSLLWMGSSTSEGDFLVDDLDTEARMILEAASDGYTPRRVPILPVLGQQSREVSVELARGQSGKIELTLLRRSGAPLARTRVALLAAGATTKALATDLDGVIRYSDLALGRYTLVWADPIAGVGDLQVHLTADAPEYRTLETVSEGVDLQLACSGAACGNQSLPPIQVVSEAGTDILAFASRTHVGLAFSAEGTAKLVRLTPGRYRVRVAHGRDIIDLPVTVEPGERVRSVELPLE